MATKLEANIYTQDGKESGKIVLPESLFGVAWNPDLVHEVVTAMQSNARANTAHTKDRGEVRGGGKKPWRQKGTGRARHGSRRSPIWTGGGVAFGPRNERNYTKKLNKKVRAKALAIVLSRKLTDDELLFVDALSFSEPKAAEAKKIIAALGSVKGKEGISTKRKNATLIVLSSRDENTEKSFRNFGQVLVEQAKDVNPVELLSYKYVVFAQPEAVLKILGKRVETREVEKPETETETKVKVSKKTKVAVTK
jgi:large subunit ribosomal protein L4